MLGIEQAFRRRQFENMHVFAQFPTVGAGALAQFALGFGQGDVQRAFAGLGASQQKVQGNGGLAGARFALQ